LNQVISEMKGRGEEAVNYGKRKMHVAGEERITHYRD
jgi:hypothetical protein